MHSGVGRVPLFLSSTPLPEFPSPPNKKVASLSSPFLPSSFKF
jgi:hypothetical protein